MKWFFLKELPLPTSFRKPFHEIVVPKTTVARSNRAVALQYLLSLTATYT